MEINVKNRLSEIDVRIDQLQEELESLKAEKYQLLQTYDKNAMSKFPTIVRNAMKRIKIENDSELVQFVDGDTTEESLLYGEIQNLLYKKANSRKYLLFMDI